MQVTHNSASFYVEAFDRNGNAVDGFIGEHLPLKVGISNFVSGQKNHRRCFYQTSNGAHVLPGFCLVQ
jgi:hypothetical protein